ncbi:hypothetical protein NMY22_g13573 [Coprinellus aureogranulatus]|nr:hypothetical protein NMY22_g13573 [Coprinellus aureogranulatus]
MLFKLSSVVLAAAALVSASLLSAQNGLPELKNASYTPYLREPFDGWLQLWTQGLRIRVRVHTYVTLRPVVFGLPPEMDILLMKMTLPEGIWYDLPSVFPSTTISPYMRKGGGVSTFLYIGRASIARRFELTLVGLSGEFNRSRWVFKTANADVLYCEDAILSRVSREREVLGHEQVLWAYVSLGPFSHASVNTGKYKGEPFAADLRPAQTCVIGSGMPSPNRGPFPPTRSTEHAVPAYLRRQKLTKLLKSARFMEPDRLKVLGLSIVQDHDLTIVSSMLDALESACMPETPVTVHNILSATKSAKLAVDAVDAIASIILALQQVKDTGKATAFLSQCFETLLERWPSITKWISFLMKHSGSWIDEGKLVHGCFRIIASIVIDTTESPYKEELKAHPATANLYALLLCKKHSQMGLYCDLTAPVGGCRITSLFAHIHHVDDGCAAIEEGLKAMARFKRRSIVSALISRAQQLVSKQNEGGKRTLAYVVESVSCLLRGIMTLCSDITFAKEFHRQDFFAKYANTLSLVSKAAESRNIVDLDFWHHLASCLWLLLDGFSYSAPNPVLRLPRLVEAGILTTGVACLRHGSGHDSAELAMHALENVLPYMYGSGVFHSAAKSGDLDFWGTPLAKLGTMSTRVAKSLRNFQQTLGLSRLTFVDRRHRPHKSTTPVGGIDWKTCSGCRFVTYCSVGCQAQDWVAFHSRECRQLAKSYRYYKTVKAWTPLKVREDQIRLLDTFINIACPSPSRIQANETVHRPQEDQEDAKHPMSARFPISALPSSSIAITHYLSTNRGVIEFHPRVALGSYIKSTWSLPEFKMWLPRVQHYVHSMEEDSRHAIILVGGVFQVKNSCADFVFARMRYSPLKPEGERYTVLNSIFRGMNRVVAETEIPYTYRSNWTPELRVHVPYVVRDRSLQSPISLAYYSAYSRINYLRRMAPIDFSRLEDYFISGYIPSSSAFSAYKVPPRVLDFLQSFMRLLGAFALTSAHFLSSSSSSSSTSSAFDPVAVASVEDIQSSGSRRIDFPNRRTSLNKLISSWWMELGIAVGKWSLSVHANWGSTSAEVKQADLGDGPTSLRTRDSRKPDPYLEHRRALVVEEGDIYTWRVGKGFLHPAIVYFEAKHHFKRVFCGSLFLGPTRTAAGVNSDSSLAHKRSHSFKTLPSPSSQSSASSSLSTNNPPQPTLNNAPNAFLRLFPFITNLRVLPRCILSAPRLLHVRPKPKRLARDDLRLLNTVVTVAQWPAKAAHG